MNDLQTAAQDALTEAAKDAGEKAAMGFFETIISAYHNFISQFPEEYQWIISLVIGIAVAGSLWNLIRRNWLWIVLAIFLFPGILPVLQNIFNSLTVLLTGNQDLG
ncbi:MAG: hypothetical protein R3B38_02665 [Patescibacteria group bacterium]